MSKGSMSLKAKINNYAKKNDLPAQVVLQNFMLERFLERLSISKYAKKFIIKGGVLIASIVGLDTRATMDLDATVKRLKLTDENIRQAVEEISGIQLSDNVAFEFVSVSPIRKDDIYGGRCIRINAVFDPIVTPLSIDVTAGDIITPSPVQYEFNGLFDDGLKIKLLGYSVETVLAEKLQAILSLGVFSTRPKDYYDIYILKKLQHSNINPIHLKNAIEATSGSRGTLGTAKSYAEIIKTVRGNDAMNAQWNKYQNKFSYAKGIDFVDTCDVVIEVMKWAGF